MAAQTSVPSPFEPKDAAYQSYSLDEERERINFHYDKPVEFMATITGDPWHVYSCTKWDGDVTLAESQEAKLDEVAAAVGMAPGKRMLDVGSGWGGPLTYFCRRYDMEGVGITPAPSQVTYSNERIAERGASAEVVETQWQEYEDEAGFDIIHSDEVAVHLNDLTGYYRHMGELLRPGGRMITRELHYNHPAHVETLSRAMQLINEIFGATGNYRTLGGELQMAYDAGMEVVSVTQVPLRHYQQTLAVWLSNMHAARDRLVELVGDAYYRAFRAYLRLARRTLTGTRMSLDMIVVKRFGDE